MKLYGKVAAICEKIGRLGLLQSLYDASWRLRNRYIRYYLKFGIDNGLIFLDAQNGAEASEVVLAFARYIAESREYASHKIILSAPEHSAVGAEARIRHVRRGSAEYVWALANAGYIIKEGLFPEWFIKKEGQIFLDIVDATAILHQGRCASGKLHRMGNIQRNLFFADYLLFRDSATATDILRDFCIENAGKGKVIIGSTENDPALAGHVADLIILGRDSTLSIRHIPDNGKPNVLVYAGEFSGNGITASFRNLTSKIDLDKCNYYLIVRPRYVEPYEEKLQSISGRISILAWPDGRPLPFLNAILFMFFKLRLIAVGLYAKWQTRFLEASLRRVLGDGRFDAAIHFSGYEDDMTLALGIFNGPKAIMVHADMVQEIAVRGNQRASTLRWAYNKYDIVVGVTEAATKSAVKIAGSGINFATIPNLVDAEGVAKRAKEEPNLALAKKLSMSLEKANEILYGPYRRIIAIGRFSPEKGHERLIAAFKSIEGDFPDARLLIVGGSSYKGGYESALSAVGKHRLADKVMLVLTHPNAVSIAARCKGLIMASYYEGFGLVLVEGDIAGIPVVSTDIAAPRPFMLEHGGTLVPNTRAGVEEGLRKLLRGEVKRLSVDYKKYNDEAVERFNGMVSDLFESRGG